MKTFIILTLIFSQNLIAKTPLASENTSLKSAVGLATRIGEIVTGATAAGAACREEQVSLPRDVVDDANKMDVIVCRPDSTSLIEPTGEDYSQLINDYKIETSDVLAFKTKKVFSGNTSLLNLKDEINRRRRIRT